jgi:hypothetical protein
MQNSFFLKTLMHGMTKNPIFDHHGADPISHAGHPRAPKRTVIDAGACHGHVLG